MAILILSQRLINLISDKEIILKEVGYVIRIPNTANIDKIGNYFDVREGNISYCPANKEQQFADSGKWKREGRETMRAGKFAALLEYYTFGEESILVKDINFSNIYEAVANIIKGDALNDGKFRVSGSISKIYNKDTSANAGEYLRNSCMRPEGNYGCRECAGFYDRVPGLKILYKTDGSGALLFRALLWNVSIGEKRRIFIDNLSCNNYLCCG